MNRTRKLAGTGALILALATGALAPAAATSSPEPTVASGPRQPVIRVSDWAPTVKYGETKLIKGKLKGGDVTGRVVQLQRKLPGGSWKFVKGDRTDGQGRYAISVPTAFYHSALPHRLAIKRTREVSKVRGISVKPNYVPVAPASAWTRIDPGYKFQYDPCQTVNYRVNLNGMDETALADTKVAIGELAKATGIRFRYAGSTTKIFRDGKRTWPKNTQLVISWATDEEVIDSFQNASAWGGAEKAVWANSPKHGRVAKIVRAGVVVDKNAGYITPGSADMSQGHPGVPRVQLLMHELAHTAGLGHVLNNHGQLMAYEGWTTNWGAGDITGLNKVGLSQGCLKPLRRAAGPQAGPVWLPPAIIAD